MPFDLSRIRHLVIDLDGTIYRDSQLFKVTLPFLSQIDRLGIGRTFVTNNSSRSKKDYLEKLHNFGIDISIEGLYTSADVTIDYLQTNLPEVRRLALLGTPSLVSQFLESGYVIDWDNPEAVIVGYDTTLEYERLCKTAWWITQGIPFLATHPDLFCPTDEPTVLIDCGAICACLGAATGGHQPIYMGKPEPLILRNIAQQWQLAITEIAMVGDRLYTDMTMAHRAGAMAILVLTGEATREEASRSSPAPDLILNDIGELGRLLTKVRRQ